MTAIQKREEFKDVEIRGKKWRVGRLDARTGSYIASVILMQVVPMGLDSQLPNLPSGREIMPKATFLDIQTECLKVCFELQQAGQNILPVAVILPDGRWGVSEESQTDISTMLTLTIQTLKFNLTDFFQGGALNELMQVFKDLPQSDVKE